jgi:hypothetical protein
MMIIGCDLCTRYQGGPRLKSRIPTSCKSSATWGTRQAPAVQMNPSTFTETLTPSGFQNKFGYRDDSYL